MQSSLYCNLLNWRILVINTCLDRRSFNCSLPCGLRLNLVKYCGKYSLKLDSNVWNTRNISCCLPYDHFDVTGYLHWREQWSLWVNVPQTSYHLQWEQEWSGQLLSHLEAGKYMFPHRHPVAFPWTFQLCQCFGQYASCISSMWKGKQKSVRKIWCWCLME